MSNTIFKTGATLVIATTAIGGSLTASADDAKKPNIVYIMADDLGWTDVGFNGAKFYESPNIDKMRAEGINFTNAYSSGPNCAPSRACLMTGMFTPRHHLYQPSGRSKGNKAWMKLAVPGSCDKGKDAFKCNNDTIDDKHTCIPEVLKKAGYITGRFGKWHLGQSDQGFDVVTSDGKPDNDKKHYGSITVADSLTNASLKFIETNKDKPFFLYLAHWDVHGPIRAKKDVVDKFKKKLEAENKQWKPGQPYNPTYAGMLEAVDKSVMRVRAKLEELGLSKNTMIVFTSDNGGKRSFNGSNDPLKSGKGALFEGGIRIPTCVVWPGKVKPGSETSIPISSVDYLPTFAAITGAPLPTDQPVDGESLVEIMKGEKTKRDKSIFWHYPLYLSGNAGDNVIPASGRTEPYWRAVPASCIRKGDWKLIHYFEDNSIKLYNIANDISEANDLSKSNAEKAQQLFAELKAWQKETKAPVPTELNPDFNPNGGNDKKAKGKKKGKKKKRKNKK